MVCFLKEHREKNMNNQQRNFNTTEDEACQGEGAV